MKYTRSYTSKRGNRHLMYSKTKSVKTKKVTKKVDKKVKFDANLGSLRVKQETKKPVHEEVRRSKLAGEQDKSSDPIRSISKVYWSKKKGQIVALVVTRAKKMTTVTLDELKTEPAELFTRFMKNLIMEEVEGESNKPKVHFKDDVKGEF